MNDRKKLFFTNRHVYDKKNGIKIEPKGERAQDDTA